MEFIDLFCGCGMFTEGMKQSGHKAVLGIDNWKVACQSYEANHCETLCENILNIDVSTLPKTELIIGSPPCQKFSLINQKKGNRTEDDTLIKKYIEIIEVLKPRFWIMEEVPRAIHYVPISWQKQILQVNHYGGIHIRKRLYAGKFPLVLAPCIKKHKTATPTNFDKLGKLNNPRNFGDKKLIMKYFGRKPTLKETMELMGLTEDYKLCGSNREKYQQIGNGVYVPLVKTLGEAMLQKASLPPKPKDLGIREAI